MPDLLIELFSEEIPARMQAKAADDLKRLVTGGLVDAGLTYASAGAFSTPRRLALSIDGLLSESPTVKEESKGPRVDAPEKALEGFLRSTGLSKDQLEARDSKKGQVWFAVIEKPGRPAADIIAELLEKTIRTFPWPKSMRWGTGSLRWVRPLHSILCILSDETGATVVPLEVDGIAADNTTEGHRFMAPGRFAVTSFEDYAAKLKRAYVVLDAKERADHIWADATNAAFAQGMEVVEDRGLLNEVAGLVEWPVMLMGDIAEDFMGLPPEVLQTSMRKHQKFFSVRNPKTGRIEKFITVANRETADNGATILAGNQKVLFARLSDAKFFWENDLRVAKDGMGKWTEAFKNVTFHNKLGTQAKRIDRIAALVREIAPIVGAKGDLAEQAVGVAKADLLSEMVVEFPELQGLMGRYYAEAAEFPQEVANASEQHYSPQGPSDNVPTEAVSVAVALADRLDLLTGFWAIDEKPTGSKDPFALRRAALGIIRLVLENGLRFELLERILDAYVAHIIIYGESQIEFYERLLEKVDIESGEKLDKRFKNPPVSSFIGLNDFSDQEISDIEIKLQGVESEVFENKDDAEGYQRASAALEKIEQRASALDTMCGAVWSFSRSISKVRTDENNEITLKMGCDRLAQDLLTFFHDRLKVFLKDKGIRHDVIDACLAMPGNDDLTLLVKRAEALAAFLKTDDGENLLQGFKRANNILSAEEKKDGVEYSYGADIKYAKEDAEKALFAALDTAEPAINAALQNEAFAEAMSAMAGLRAPIDAFFDAVQVNADSALLRRNRLNLLSRIRSICSSVADLRRVEG